MIQLLRRQFGICALLIVSVLCIGAMTARADITISEPTNGATVRGEINVRYSGVPDGGYVIVKVDGNFAQATAQSSFSLNTFDAQSFGISQNGNTDGQHQISITGVDASGKNTSTAAVSFNVANNQVDVTAPAVQLTHWVPADRLEEGAQRYRIFAESNATITSLEGQSGSGASGGSGAGEAMPDAGGGAPKFAGGGTGQLEGWIPSPLDWQYSALLRRVVRDVGGYEGAANIKISMAEAFARQRESTSYTESSLAESLLNEGSFVTGPEVQEQNTTGVPMKAPWSPTWQKAPEMGTYFVKAIKPDGEEINATRKKRSIAVTDLLPLFPMEKVQPGSRWETQMTFLSNLSTREPFNVKVPMTFTGYEDIKLPSGEVRHAAKIECRFILDTEKNRDVITKMAAQLAVDGDLSGGASEEQFALDLASPMDIVSDPRFEANGKRYVVGGPTDRQQEEFADKKLNEMIRSIGTATMRVSRVIWFDVDWHRILRSEDNINTYFEMKPPAPQANAGTAMGNIVDVSTQVAAGVSSQVAQVAVAAVEPTKVNYTMNVVTWYDDTVPPPTDQYNGGKGTPHSKDNVQEPSLSKVTNNF